jgi:MerR family transcriptional regulator, heat shock protein HspR
VRKYYLQVYSGPWDSWNQEGRILLDDLPFEPLLLERLAALGIIEPKDGMLSPEEVERVNKILRLRQSLGVNLSGATIIIELLDRLEAMEEEIERRRGV